MSYSIQVENLRRVINEHLKPSDITKRDPSGISHKGVFCYTGNVKTGKTLFDASGECAPGRGFTLDTLYNPASVGKIMLGLVLGKMMEEGIVLGTDKCSTYWNRMTGTGYYITNVDFSYPTANPYVYGSNPANPADLNITTAANVEIDGSSQTVYYCKPFGSSVTTSTFSWADITISDLMKMDLGMLQDGFLAGVGALQLIAGSASYTEADLINDPMLAASLYQASVICNSSWFLPFIGQTSKIGDALRIYNLVTDGSDTTLLNFNTSVDKIMDNMIQLNKANILPAMYKTGVRSTLRPLNINTLPKTYDTAYTMLGVVLDKALRTKLNMSFVEYARQKILIPCNMNDTYFSNVDNLPSDYASRVYVDSFRRATALPLGTLTLNFTNPAAGGFNPLAYGADPSYNAIATAAATANPYWGPFGPLVWASDFKNDGIYKFHKSIFARPTGNPNSPPYCSLPIILSIRDFGKLLQMMAAQGVYRGRTVLNKETWSYITSTKQTELSILGGMYFFESDSAKESDSAVACIGNYKPGILGNTHYGMDEYTRYGGGASGSAFTFDFNTGNWVYFGMPESSFGTGGLYPGGIYGQKIVPNYLIALNSNVTFSLPLPN